jgi:hypothetical protein
VTDVVEIPEWPGGGCINTRCPGAGKHRILSIEEIEKVYPIKDKFDWWPVPDGTTHVCTVCGFCYSGVSEDYQSRQHEMGQPQIELDITEWNWEFESQFEVTVRQAVEDFINAAPAEKTTDEIALGVARFVVGADDEFAREVMSEMDEYDKPALTVDQFM